MVKQSDKINLCETYSQCCEKCINESSFIVRTNRSYVVQKLLYSSWIIIIIPRREQKKIIKIVKFETRSAAWGGKNSIENYPDDKSVAIDKEFPL